jgi:MFS family permease
MGQTFASFRNYNFRLFWSGQLISLLGTWMQMIGQAWLVLDLTHSPVSLGFVSVLQSLPILAMVLFAGVIVDRLPKHKMLLATQALLLTQSAVLAGLTATGLVQVWHIYVLAVILGLVTAFDNPTRQAFVVELVGREHTVNAMGLASAQFNSAKLLGPAVGGLVIARWGVAACFWLNAVSFLAVLLSLLLLRRHELVPAHNPDRGSSVLAGVIEGARFMLGKPELAVVIILLAGLGAFVYSTSWIITLVAQEALHVGPTEYGLMVSAVGLGSLAAAMGLAMRGRSSVRSLLASATGFGVLYLGLAFVPTFAVAMVVLGLLGWALQWFGTSATSLLQLGSPDRFRGRAMSVFSLLTGGLQPLGSLFMGFMAASVGIRATVGAEAAICLLTVAVALVYCARVVAPSAARRPAEAAGIAP